VSVLDHALAVAAAKAKLTGLVIAAAAIGGTAVAAGSTAFVPSSGEDTVTTVATESPSPEANVEPTVAPAAEPAPEAPAPAVTPPPCPADVKNHGAYVSQVAHDDSVKGRDHGKLVSAAAQSDCGKTGEDADEAAEAPDTEDTDAPDADEQEESESQDDADEADEDGADHDTPKSHKSGGKHHRH
jgi:hypothetical protein